jgi:hypothetical protein
MPNRPDPTPIPALDAKALRRAMKVSIGPEYILDEQEWDELLDFSHTNARLNVMRKNLISARRAGGQGPRMLRPEERSALALYRMGEGPRPAFALYIDSHGRFGGQTIAPRAERGVTAPAPDPVEDPTEPGRFVQPTGRFAQSHQAGFTPDTR